MRSMSSRDAGYGVLRIVREHLSVWESHSESMRGVEEPFVSSRLCSFAHWESMLNYLIRTAERALLTSHRSLCNS